MTKLSKDEKHWLLAHPQLRFHLPDFGLPLGTDIKQEYKGIVADHISYFDSQLSTQWSPDDRFDASLLTVDLSEADITIGNNLNPQLNENYLFSRPVIKMPVVMLTANPSRVYVDGLTELGEVKAAVLAVNSGDVDILLCPLLHCSYLMNELVTQNIRVIGQTALTDTLSFSVLKGWPVLLSIINKLLAAMTPQQKKQYLQTLE